MKVFKYFTVSHNYSNLILAYCCSRECKDRWATGALAPPWGYLADYLQGLDPDEYRVQKRERVFTEGPLLDEAPWTIACSVCKKLILSTNPRSRAYFKWLDES